MTLTNGLLSLVFMNNHGSSVKTVRPLGTEIGLCAGYQMCKSLVNFYVSKMLTSVKFGETDSTEVSI